MPEQYLEKIIKTLELRNNESIPEFFTIKNKSIYTGITKTSALDEAKICGSPLLNQILFYIPADYSYNATLDSGQSNLLHGIWNIATLSLHPYTSCWPIAASYAATGMLKLPFIQQIMLESESKNLNASLVKKHCTDKELIDINPELYNLCQKEIKLQKLLEASSELPINIADIFGTAVDFAVVAAALSPACPIINIGYKILGISQLLLGTAMMATAGADLLTKDRQTEVNDSLSHDNEPTETIEVLGATEIIPEL